MVGVQGTSSHFYSEGTNEGIFAPGGNGGGFGQYNSWGGTGGTGYYPGGGGYHNYLEIPNTVRQSFTGATGTTCSQAAAFAVQTGNSMPVSADSERFFFGNYIYKKQTDGSYALEHQFDISLSIHP